MLSNACDDAAAAASEVVAAAAAASEVVAAAVVDVADIHPPMNYSKLDFASNGEASPGLWSCMGRFYLGLGISFLMMEARLRLEPHSCLAWAKHLNVY